MGRKGEIDVAREVGKNGGSHKRAWEQERQRGPGNRKGRENEWMPVSGRLEVGI